MSRRPSVSIYDYPEHLNPFSDDIAKNQQAHFYPESKSKDSKHKFWTFGKSRKKRSNSFSIKSTWSGLFGKRKEDRSDAREKRSTITTVSSTYKRDPYVKPAAPQRPTKDQEEFDEALGTLARRRKYTLDNSSSRYSSSLTVNGDPARLYDGSPQENTASIMGDLTPKPPARRFGQVSPKPTDKIPPLDYENKSPKENGTVVLREKSQERTPIPPLRRFGNRASQRTNASILDPEEDANRSVDVTMCDENENVPADYMFKRQSQDTFRKSNLSINSCISVGSTMSSYGRKKRRAPQPPRRTENVETKEEQRVAEIPNVELQIVEPSDIAKVAENIDEMTKKSKNLDKEVNEAEAEEVTLISDDIQSPEKTKKGNNETNTTDDDKTIDTKEIVAKNENVTKVEEEVENVTTEDRNKEEISEETDEKSDEEPQIEYRRVSQEKLEIIKQVDQVHALSELDEVCLRKKGSSSSLSRSESFSVKDEIEKIERQIKALETRNASTDSSEEKNSDNLRDSARLSIHENRRNFFQNMVETAGDKNGIKIEFKEFPREQKDIHVVRLDGSHIPTVAPRESVKVIELHISEPIRQKAEILEDVNPIPKPRRHSELNLNDSEQSTATSLKEARRSMDSTRGKSF